MRFYSEGSSEAQMHRAVHAINSYIAKKEVEYLQRTQSRTGENFWDQEKVDDEANFHSYSQNDREEEFKRAKSVLSGIGSKKLTTRNMDKGDLITSDTYP